MQKFFPLAVWVLGALMFSASASGQTPITTISAIAELSEVAAAEPDDHRLLESVGGGHPVAWVDGRLMVGFLGRLPEGTTCDDLGPLPGSVLAGACKNGVMSFRVDIRHLDVIQDLPLAYLEIAAKARPDLNTARSATRADSVQAGLGGLPQGYIGNNVLIGIVDWGFDYTHPMFYDTTLSVSRVRGIWDQFRQAGPAPAAYPYGTALTDNAAILALGADTAGVYSYATHGTHVAGIAGGSGAGIGLRGMAPGAEFLFASFLVDAAAAMDAFAWMQSIAEADNKRLVINMSWGLTWIGSRDGNSPLNAFIDAMSEEGVVFTGSAGNNGDYNFHIDHTFAGNDTLRSKVKFYSYAAHPQMWGQDLAMWGEPGQPFEAGFELMSSTLNGLGLAVWHSTDEGPTFIDTMMVHNGDTILYNLAIESAHPANGRPYMRLRVNQPHPNYAVILHATAPDGRVHFYNTTHLSNDVGNWGQDFQGTLPDWTSGDANYGIGDPASTESVITVAAYRAEYFSPGGTELGGQPANFTTLGPTLDERMKPDLAAPGVSVASSISSVTDANYSLYDDVEFEGTTYPFAKFSGTSMSAPAVAGIAALLLEADPTLSPAEVRQVLKDNARQDDETGEIPDEGSTLWGVGKVNALWAVQDVLGVNRVVEVGSGDWRVWPNPALDHAQLQFPSPGMPFEVVDAAGRVWQRSQSELGPTTIDLNGWPTGMYFITFETAQGKTALPLVKP